jgi:hypothetical protein
MKIIITESQYDFLLSEQSNVYTDEAKYKKALKAYNRKTTIHQLWLGLYNERGVWSKFYGRGGDNPAFFTPNMLKLQKLIHTSSMDILIAMDNWYRCMNNLPQDDGRKVDWCEYMDSVYKELGSPTIEKWNKISLPNSPYRNKYTWLPTFKKPNTQKPIFKKPPTQTPTKQEPPKVNKPVAPTKPTTPPTPTSTLDKTKPVDFYFGNRIFRAPTFDIAQNFANKLVLHNFNSNKVDVLKDKTNERWFVGYNDKIYLNQNVYNQDPNDPYVDPVKMGLISL